MNKKPYPAFNRIFKVAALILIVCLSIFLPSKPRAQEIPVGAWRLHLTHHEARTVAVAGQKVYSASKNGLFFYDQASKSVQTLSELDGLSDNSIVKLRYHDGKKLLCLLYENGNLDFLKEGEIINVRTLFNSTRNNRKIADAVIDGNTLWIATGFGGIAVDLNNFSIKEYVENLGGSPVEGQSIAINGDSVFLATSQGLFVASLQPQVNRQDWQNWRTIATTLGNMKQLQAVGGQLYALSASGKILIYQQGKIKEDASFAGKTFQGLAAINGKIAGLGAEMIQPKDAASIKGEWIKQPQEAAQDAQGTVWIADAQAGLVSVEGGNFEHFFPSGPFSPQVFRLLMAGTKLIALSGGYDRWTLIPKQSFAGFYVFEEGLWKNYTSQAQFVEAQAIPAAPDLNCAVYDAANQTVLIGSYGNGILTFNIQKNTVELMPASPLYVTGLAIDGDGKRWACSLDGGVYAYEGTEWKKYTSANRPIGLLSDLAGNIWVRQAQGNVLVWGKGKQRTFIHDKAAGGMRGAFPMCMAQSRDESIWIGTDDGISEFFDPFSVFSGGSMSTVYGLNGLPLNQGETITALAFDGGGRAWVGTANGGVWLYSRAGEVLGNFNDRNSPLLSNEILDIAVHPKTGEVFFATSKGIASYRGMATESAAASGVAIFPNPVTMSYQGWLSVSGLAQGAQVRMTDMAGRLVWQGEAAGGTATWNLVDYSGRRLQPGIYLIFSASSTGEQTFVGKVAVVE